MDDNEMLRRGGRRRRRRRAERRAGAGPLPALGAGGRRGRAPQRPAPATCTTTWAARARRPPSCWRSAAPRSRRTAGRCAPGRVARPPWDRRRHRLRGRPGRRPRGRPPAGCWSPPGSSTSCPTSPGCAERWGRDVLHCPYCHGWEVRDRAIGIVLARHRMSLHQALLFRQSSDDVVMLLDGAPGPDADDGRAAGRARHPRWSPARSAESWSRTTGSPASGWPTARSSRATALVVAPRFTAALGGAGVARRRGRGAADGRDRVRHAACPPTRPGPRRCRGSGWPATSPTCGAQVIRRGGGRDAGRRDDQRRPDRGGRPGWRSAHRRRAAGDVRAADLGGAVRRRAEHLEREPATRSWSPRPPGWRRAGRSTSARGEGADAIWLAERGWSGHRRSTSPGSPWSGPRSTPRPPAPTSRPAPPGARPTCAAGRRPAPTRGGLRPGHLALLPPARPGHARPGAGLATAVAPGGTLLVVGHHPGDLATGHRWGAVDMMYTAADLVPLLDPAEWDVEVAEDRPREVPAPAGEREGEPRESARGRHEGRPRGAGPAGRGHGPRRGAPGPPPLTPSRRRCTRRTPSRRRCTPLGRRVGADVRSDRPPAQRRAANDAVREGAVRDRLTGRAACRSRPGGTPRPRRARPTARPRAPRWRARRRRAARRPPR